VARKRHPLAADLTATFLRERGGQSITYNSMLTVIAHTRFATSSVNLVPELHPHEWAPMRDEVVWTFNIVQGRYERGVAKMGVHITHNGDFDAMDAYAQVMVNEEVGYWLARVLYTHNPARSDSCKIAGMMELLRVQGRWAASARLSWVRTVLSACSDVSGGQMLTEHAPFSFPTPAFFLQWSIFLEQHWMKHINNIIVPVTAPFNHHMAGKRFYYRIKEAAVVQFQSAICKSLKEGSNALKLGAEKWNLMKTESFVHHAVRGFLKMDIYNAVTELLGRGEGSFGLQVHCSLEPGVVVLASKGQPMSISYCDDPEVPLVLFASEGEALAVPVYESGKSMKTRMDLDGRGEVVRIGDPRALLEGQFTATEKLSANVVSPTRNRGHSEGGAFGGYRSAYGHPLNRQQCLLLPSGVELRAYVLDRKCELGPEDFAMRAKVVVPARVPYDPHADLVKTDLEQVPAVLNAIDRAWLKRFSSQRVAGQSLSEHLCACMRRRLTTNLDTIDLLIGGIEASLWLAEQFAADLRRVFPYLNVSTVSSNKLLGFGDQDSSKVFFPTSEDHTERRVGPHTCVLLVSQSGQTFATLHATRKLCPVVPSRLWILTGCVSSKMESAMTDCYAKLGMKYGDNRVMDNLSGHRPAEPTSIAVAATWHTMTRLLMHLIFTARVLMPAGRIVHDWVYHKNAVTIQTYMRRHSKSMRRLHFSQTQLASHDSSLGEFNKLLNPFETPEKRSRCGSGESIRRGSGEGRVRLSSENSNSGHVQVHVSAAFCDMGMYVKPVVLMRLTDGCIQDFNSLLADNLVPNICCIVGRDINGHLLNDITSSSIHSNVTAGRDNSVHDSLVESGRKWAAHIDESWQVLVLAGAYIIISVSLGIPLCGVLADIVVAILQVGGVIGPGHLGVTLRHGHASRLLTQHPGWAVGALLVQLADAVLYIYCGKHITRLVRLASGRPLHARLGKRTIVIVDTPTVHQLLENFVSKLYSQSYSVMSVEVHGASGLDHFVHRFTHRVVRGVLLAVGRPDGRLCCLAKSEASTLLAVKQAAFIRNPEYELDGSGPDIITIGHNPYVPNIGLASHVVLNSVTSNAVTTPKESSIRRTASHVSRVLAGRQGFVDLDVTVRKLDGATLRTTTTEWKRHRFLDMYLYNRLFMSEKPFTTAILRSLRFSLEFEAERMRIAQHKALRRSSIQSVPLFMREASISGAAGAALNSPHAQRMRSKLTSMAVGAHGHQSTLPYGVHHINPSLLANARSIQDSNFATFVRNNVDMLRKMKSQQETTANKSNDPAMVQAFIAKLDDDTKIIVDRQVVVQQLYECRIASLERYIAFCVMFHAMAEVSSKPWLCEGWNVTRSQSNLRVATTASPIMASEESHGVTFSKAVVSKARKDIGILTRKVQTNF